MIWTKPPWNSVPCRSSSRLCMCLFPVWWDMDSFPWSVPFQNESPNKSGVCKQPVCPRGNLSYIHGGCSVPMMEYNHVGRISSLLVDQSQQEYSPDDVHIAIPMEFSVAVGKYHAQFTQLAVYRWAQMSHKHLLTGCKYCLGTLGCLFKCMAPKIDP